MGASPAHAEQVAKIAARIDEFPLVRGSFGRGELSIDQVYEVVMKAPAWADAKMDNFAKISTVRQLRRMIRDEHFDGDPDEPKPQPAPVRDRVGFGWDEHDRFGLHANVDAATGAVVEAAMNEARDSLFRAGDESVTWVDALTEVLLCDGLVQPVWERDHTPVGVGRTQRAVPDRLRRLIEHRDQGCRVPGCGSTHVEIHHIVHWSVGGPTETWNLVSACPRHHQRHHRGALGIVGNADQPDGLVFPDADGRILDHHGRPKLPTGPPPEPDGRYEHPTGERMDGRWIDWAHPNARQQRAEFSRESCERRAEIDREAQRRAARDWYDQNSP
jgi:hypothetical protein